MKQSSSRRYWSMFLVCCICILPMMYSARAESQEYLLEKMVQGPRDMQGLIYGPSGDDIAIRTGSTIALYSIGNNTIYLSRTIQDAHIRSGCWIGDLLYISISNYATLGLSPITVLSAQDLAIVGGIRPKDDSFSKITAAENAPLIAGISRTDLYVIDVQTNKTVYHYEDPMYFLSEVSWGHDSVNLATTNTGAVLTIFNLTKQDAHPFFIDGLQTEGLLWDEAKNWIYNFNKINKSMDVIDYGSGVLRESRYLSMDISCVDLSLSRNTLFLGSFADLVLLDLTDMTIKESYEDASGGLIDVHFDYRHNRVITASYDGFIRVYVNQNAPDYNEPPEIVIHYPGYMDSVNGSFYASGAILNEDYIAFLLLRLNDDNWRYVGNSSLWRAKVDAAECVDGKNTLYVRASDGEKETTAYVDFIFSGSGVQNEPPSVAILSPLNGSTVRELVIVRGEALDDISVKSVQVRFDGGPWLEANGNRSWEMPYIVEGADVAVLEARAFDGELYSKIERVEVMVDRSASPSNEAPVLEVADPVEGGSYMVELPFDGSTLDESSDAATYARFGDSGWWRVSNDTRWSGTIAIVYLEPGPHRITFIAFDGELLSATVTRSFTKVPYAPPAVSITSPSLDEYFIDELDVSGQVTGGEGGIQVIEVRVDGIVWRQVENASEWNLMLDGSAFEPGVLQLEVRARDAYSWSAVEERSVLLYPPLVLNVSSPRPGEHFEGDMVVSGTVEEGWGERLVIEISIDNKTMIDTQVGRSWTFTLKGKDVPNGAITVGVRVRDEVMTSDVTNIVVVHDEGPDASIGGRDLVYVAVIIVLISVIVIQAVAWRHMRRTGR